jgi:hypothetical protein
MIKTYCINEKPVFYISLGEGHLYEFDGALEWGFYFKKYDYKVGTNGNNRNKTGMYMTYVEIY